MKRAWIRQRTGIEIGYIPSPTCSCRRHIPSPDAEEPPNHALDGHDREDASRGRQGDAWDVHVRYAVASKGRQTVASGCNLCVER